MKKHNFSILLKVFVFTFFISILLSCDAGNKKEEKRDSIMISATSEVSEAIPDSTVQFLITSASIDFSKQKHPTPIDFRHVKAGYTLSTGNEKIYVLCGEFLAQEDKENWLSFATIKTSGYEQYLGNQARAFCEKATISSTGNVDLSVELKNKLAVLRK
ncbi:hypothetical protein [Emticicia sp. BO119]|uniref:hypothetical protein n=1 Tax=Emticicia sp. BO119 TaxID=2757768 RepID=UPI0015F05E75|nr:hypothetical protein [Emticicia sp. BO119]MBA4851440.1 hypothetical protein [Emticicia sp. BO119]